MSQHSNSSVEVLVHISAPGAVRDDATYRSQASACLAFEPVKRVSVVPEQDDVILPPPPSTVEDADTTFGSFTSSWPSSAEAAYDPGHQIDPIEPEGEGDEEPCTPPSTVPDSQGAASPLSSYESDRTDTPTPTPTPTPPLTWDEVERNQSPDASPIKPIYISISSSNDSPLPSSVDEAHAEADIQLDTDTQPATQPDADSDAQAQSQSQPDATQLHLPMEIHPPHPNPSSTARFKTHLTPALCMLLSHSKLSKRYAPTYQYRALCTSERGYWFLRVPVSTAAQGSAESSHGGAGGGKGDMCKGKGKGKGEAWEVDRFMRFWGYLREYVGLGRAGWGVWCYADYAEVEGDRGKYVDVWVCTWGEVVEAVYLVLYMASDKAVAGLDMVEWRDASEKVVVRM